jgi:small subunit ribosomal protein S6
MPFYEHIFIARQDVQTQQVDAIADDFTKIIEANGGKVAAREYWGLRSLTYRIKKNRKGHYVMLNLDAPPAALAELERNVRLNEDVLRYMSIRVDALEEGPSIMMQKPRDERPRRDGDRGRGRDFGTLDLEEESGDE